MAAQLRSIVREGQSPELGFCHLVKTSDQIQMALPVPEDNLTTSR